MSDNLKKIFEYGGLAIGIVLIVGTILFGSLFKMRERVVEVKKAEVVQETQQKNTFDIPHEAIVVESPTIDYKGEKVEASNIEKLPEQKMFQSFSYDEAKGKIIDISGVCTDAYYTFVLFKSTDDYKKNITAALINSARPCPGNGKIKDSIDLSVFGLRSGEYYAFIADQGNKGSWYNPR